MGLVFFSDRICCSLLMRFCVQDQCNYAIENLTTFHQASRALGTDLKGVVIYTAGMLSLSWGKVYVRIFRSF